MSSLGQSTLSLVNVDEQGNAPVPERMSSGYQAKALVETLVDANDLRFERIARIQGMLDGNSPYDQEKLNSAGQNYRSNVNFHEGGAILETALSPYYTLVTSQAKFARIETGFGRVEERQRWNQIISEEFNQMVDDWSGFDHNIQIALRDHIAFGKGYLFWENDRDWRFRVVPHKNVLVPDGAAASVEELDVMVVLQEFRVHELYAYIKDEAAAAKVGWDVTETQTAIAKAVPKDHTRGSYENWVFAQEKIREGDLYQSVRADIIQAAHIFIQEYDGTVTHGLVNRNSDQDAYMYYNASRYDEFNNVMATLFYDIGNGTWNSIRGLGTKIYGFVEIKTRLKNAYIDGGFLRSGLLLKALDQGGIDEFGLVQAGNATIIPQNFEVQPSNIMTDMESAISLDRVLNEDLMANTGIYRQRISGKEGAPRTATQVNLDAEQQAALGNDAVNRLYGQLDKAYSEMYRRALTFPDKHVNKFKKRVIARGVPEEAMEIENLRRVKAERMIGNGSNFHRQQSLGNLIAIAGSLPEDGRQKLIHDYVVASTNKELGTRYAGNASDQRMPNFNHWQADQENKNMRNGSVPMWTPDQADDTHLEVHMKFTVELLEALQQGKTDAVTAADILGVAIQHMRQHQGSMANDESVEDKSKAWGKQLNELEGMYRDILNAAQEQQAEQQDRQANGGMTPEQAKQQQDMQLKQAKAENEMSMKQVQTASQIENSKRITDNQIKQSERVAMAQTNK